MKKSRDKKNLLVQVADKTNSYQNLDEKVKGF